MPSITLPEHFKIVYGSPPVATTATVGGDYVNLRTSEWAWAIFQYNPASIGGLVLTPQQATTTAGAGVKALTNACEIWRNAAVATNDTLTRQTAATSLTLTAVAGTDQLVVFGIDPAECLDQANDFDCFRVNVGIDGSNGNIGSMVYLLDATYKEDDPPRVT